MHSTRTSLAAALIFGVLSSGAWAAQSWTGAQVMPKSGRVEILDDSGAAVSMYDIAWPAAVQKTKGRFLWVQDEGGYGRNQNGGWIYNDDVVKLDGAHDYYADKLREGETAWLDWMCGVSWEASGEPGIAILNYRNALAIDPKTRIDDVHLRLGRLIAQQQLKGGRGKYDPAQRAAWESQFQSAQAINPYRPQLYYEWGLALTHACSCTQPKPMSADRVAANIGTRGGDPSSDEKSARNAPVGPTPAGADAAVQSLAYYEYAEKLSPRWWRIPLARAELMLNQCDQESPDCPGERAIVRNGKPEFYTQLVSHCKKKVSHESDASMLEAVNAGNELPAGGSDANQAAADATATVPPPMSDVLQLAMEDFNRTISLNSNALDAYRDRAEVLRLMHRLDEAEESATMACQLCYYRQPGSLRTLAQIHQDLQHFPPAADYALRAAELADGDEQQRYLKLWCKCSAALQRRARGIDRFSISQGGIRSFAR